MSNSEQKRAVNRAWYARNAEHCRTMERARYRRNKNKIAQQRRDRIGAIRAQRGLPEPTRPEPVLCECCGRHFSSTDKRGYRLSLDHDHTTGKFRGWLCGDCNRGIGLLGDNLEGVRRALAYLETVEILT